MVQVANTIMPLEFTNSSINVHTYTVCIQTQLAIRNIIMDSYINAIVYASSWPIHE